MENNKNKKTLLAVYTVLALVLVAGVTYAFITIILQGQRENTITGGELTLNLDDSDGSNGDGDIMIADAFPMSDEAGKQSEKTYTFTLTNSSPKNANYIIYLDEEEITDPNDITLEDNSHPEEVPQRLDNKYVKVYLTDGDGNVMMAPKDGPSKVSDLTSNGVARTVKGTTYETGKSHVLYSGVINAASDFGKDNQQATVKKFVLRMWIADDAGEGMTDQDSLKEIMGRYYATKISVDADQVKEYAVTVINKYTDGTEAEQTETKSTAVYAGGNAVFTDLSASTTEEGKTPTVSCIKSNKDSADNANVVTEVTAEGKFNLTINDVADHLVCTITHESVQTP